MGNAGLSRNKNPTLAELNGPATCELARCIFLQQSCSLLGTRKEQRFLEARDCDKITQFALDNCPLGAGPMDLVVTLDGHCQFLDKLQLISGPIYDQMQNAANGMSLGDAIEDHIWLNQEISG